ncbi:hypothetical protein EDB84DRAFT_1570636 [Lactarius hengduanensis]|nr:hypothetical protein EDB84DRAFT_1570636 [Lactarius hengduanensis]
MSTSLRVSSPTSNFQSILDKALIEYKTKTRKDLITHPLADQIKSCDSPGAILAVLQEKANKLKRSQNGDERLTKWLTPTVNILTAFSSTLGEGVSTVFPPTKIIFSAIGILLVAAKDTAASRDVLIELFDKIESFFVRIQTYTEVPPTTEMINVMGKIMAEVLSILAIMTKEMKQGRTKTFFKRLAGRTDVEDALRRLDRLEQGELRTVAAQVLKATGDIKDGVERIEVIAQRIVIDVGARDYGCLPPDPSTNHKHYVQCPHERHLDVLFKEVIYEEWESKGPLLWIHGKPGSGKSVLWFGIYGHRIQGLTFSASSAIIQHIVALRDAGLASIAYFYFDFRDTDKKHRRNLLCSLLIQLSAYSNPCCEILYRIYSEYGQGTQQPNDDTLKNCLWEMFSVMSAQHPIYIIMDAVDECPDTPGAPSPRQQVLSLVKDLVDRRLPNLHICVTSRPEIDIRNTSSP